MSEKETNFRWGRCEKCGQRLHTCFGGIYGDCENCGWQRVLPLPELCNKPLHKTDVDATESNRTLYYTELNSA